MQDLPISMTTTAPTAGSLSVLWVDDDHELAEGLADYLRGEGYLLSSALTLAEARQQLQDRAYDLVLVDLSLPDGSGMSLRSEERSVGKECVSTCRSRGVPE